MAEIIRLMDKFENPASQNNTLENNFGNTMNNSLNATGKLRRPVNT